MRICGLESYDGPTNKLLEPKFTWQRFSEVTGKPFGWILGDFRTDDDLWALPIRGRNNNWYLTGQFDRFLYHTLDLEASSVEILKIRHVFLPVFSNKEDKFTNSMRMYEELARRKLLGEYKDEIEKACIKNTLNAASGYLGRSHPTVGLETNPAAYSTVLAQSHLDMSRIFHRYHTPNHPIEYTDTDSFFWYQPVNTTFETVYPYPNLPFQVIESFPINIVVKGESRIEGIQIHRGKMYFQNPESYACAGWKPYRDDYRRICEELPTTTTVQIQVSRRWRTKDHRAARLKTGRWYIAEDKYNLAKLKQLFRADKKRRRETYDSYQLCLDNEKRSSRAWTLDEYSGYATTYVASTPSNNPQPRCYSARISLYGRLF